MQASVWSQHDAPAGAKWNTAANTGGIKLAKVLTPTASRLGFQHLLESIRIYKWSCLLVVVGNTTIPLHSHVETCIRPLLEFSGEFRSYFGSIFIKSPLSLNMSDTLVAQIPQAFHHESEEVPDQFYLEPKLAALSDDLRNELYELLLLAFDQDQAVEGTTKRSFPHTRSLTHHVAGLLSVSRLTTQATVYEAVSNGQAEIVVCAADVVQDFALDHVPALCESHSVLYVFVPSRYVLGQSCGFDYPISAATITCHESSDLAAAITEMKEKLQENQSGM